jgi:hypothetical protein
MRDPLSARIPFWTIAPAALAATASILAIFLFLREPPPGAEAGGAETGVERRPMTVFRFVDPDEIVHRSRLQFTFDPPEALRDLRSEEALDELIAGAGTDLERFRRVMEWARRQFDPGVPDPYPPLDARIILRDIRSGFTGGFCAQYNYVLAQALMSLGYPARYVTVVDHEVIEAWLRDEGRWLCLDPLHAATYVDETGRPLSVLDVSERLRNGGSVIPGPGSLPGTAAAAAHAFEQFQVWVRNDHVSNPINFSDIERYKVRFLRDGEAWSPQDGMATTSAEDLYAPPPGG